MEQTSQIAQRLQAVAKELAAIAQALAGETETVEFPRHAIQRMESGLCLNCDRKPEEIKQMRRGLCPACYQKANKQILKNPLADRELIKSGLLAPVGFSLHSSLTPIDEFISNRASKAAVSEAEKLVASKREKSKKNQGGGD